MTSVNSLSSTTNSLSSMEKETTSLERYVKRGHPIVAGVMILFSIFELALSAWLTARFQDRHDQSNQSEVDRVHLILFTSAWTIILSSFYALLYFHRKNGFLVSVASHLVFLSFTWMLWTCGAAAITHLLGGGLNCAKEKDYVYCTQLNALEGFAWVEWGIVTLVLIFMVTRAISASRRGDGYRGPLV